MTTERYGISSDEARQTIRKMKAWAARMAANPAAAKEFLIKNGFITRTGKLPKRYGG